MTSAVPVANPKNHGPSKSQNSPTPKSDIPCTVDNCFQPPDSQNSPNPDNNESDPPCTVFNCFQPPDPQNSPNPDNNSKFLMIIHSDLEG
ncbi:16526_t:CDS:2 [Cetraspora pellucida]|uniref:16526_t:CDS:1 n=1 Tax=Cetraspora pellucida TaxID=1433469 RepID=A0A9N9H4E0_9GLOM|nr:16526_t:CDS:2 [Cetraspora pellucida]